MGDDDHSCYRSGGMYARACASWPVWRVERPADGSVTYVCDAHLAGLVLLLKLGDEDGTNLVIARAGQRGVDL